MTMGKVAWRNALCVTVMGIAACSDEPGTSSGNAGTASTGNPIVTLAGSGAGNVAGSTAAPASGSSTGTGGAGQGAAGSTAIIMAGASPGAGAAGTTGAAAGSSAPAAGASAAGSGGSPAVMMPGVACNPADKKPDPKPASFMQIMGYTRLSMPPTTGPNEPVLESDPGLPEWTVYRPETLGGEELHPVLAWGNGGCLRNGTLYGPWLLELASHGYIVLADGPPTAAGSDPVGAGMRAGATGEVLISALEWLIAENDRPCSQYYHKVAVTKLAVAGQSCGGLMALASAGDKRITTAIIGNSGLFAADQRTYGALHSPIAYLIGGPNDLAYSNAERDFMNIDNVPIFYGNMNVGHGGTWNASNGGEFGRVGLAWLNWQLKGDMAAQKLFVGADCELCKAPSMWDVKKKMLD